MELPPPTTVPQGSHALAWSFLAVISIPLVLLAGCGIAIAAFLPLYFHASERDGFVVADGACRIDPLTETALVELTVSRINGEGEYFSLEPLSNAELFLAGTAAIPSGRADASDSIPPLSSVRDQLDDDDFWIDVDWVPTTVILEFRRESLTTNSTLPELTLNWSRGEIGNVQTVPLNLEWTTAGCTVDVT